VKESELIELLKLTPQTIWNNDLDAFLKEWEVRYLVGVPCALELTSGHARVGYRRGERQQAEDQGGHQSCAKEEEEGGG